jgi:hypothetical protein
MSELKICKCCGTPIAEDEQQFNFMHDDFHICINVFQKRIAALESQLESLTPGGSEFHGSAQHCIEWIKDRLSTTGKIAAERNMLESQLAAANEWIPVSERLPEVEGLYCVTGKYVDGHIKVFSCYFHGNSYRTHGTEWETSVNEITHWRPLPEPPHESRIQEAQK